MLRIQNVSKSYGNKKAVDNISLHIQPGEIYGIIGHNGAGKTTLIKMITGIIMPDSCRGTNDTEPNGAGKTTTLKSVIGVLKFDKGEIFVNGINVKDDPIACKKVIAYIPDNPDIYEFMTGIQYLNFVADIFGVSSDERAEKIHKYAGLFELTADLAQPISSYSHGMKQKLAIISAWIHSPKLIIMDEPFVGLDPKAAHILKEMMREVCDEGGAIFFSTHVLDVAEKLCDKVAIIMAGKLLKCGTMEEVKGDSSLENVFLDLADKNDGDKNGGEA